MQYCKTAQVLKMEVVALSPINISLTSGYEAIMANQS